MNLVLDVVSLKELQDDHGLVKGWWRWFGQFHRIKMQRVDGHLVRALVVRFIGLEVGLHWIEERDAKDGNDLPS